MINLRNFKDEDIDKLISWVTDEKFLLTWSGPKYKYPLTKEQVKEDVKEENKKVYTAVDSTSGEVVGHIELHSIDKENKTAVIGRVLIGNTKNRGKGMGKNMIKALLQKCFSEFGLKKVFLVVFDYNDSAIACYKKAGFKVEKILKDIREFHGEKLSLISMFINKEDFK